MKKLVCALAALGLGTCLSAQGALFTGNDSNTVAVPSLKGGFEGGITGLYFDANYPQNHYVLVDHDGDNNLPGQGKIKDVGYDYCFGFGINLGYIIPNSGNDIRATYFYINNSDDDSITEPEDGSFRLQSLATHPDPIFEESIDEAKGDIDLTNHVVDLEVGQRVDFGCRLSMRFFLAGSYADLDKEFKVHYFDEFDDDEMAEENNTFESNFWGIGPKAGVDTSFALGGGFGLVGRLASAVYIGKIKTKTNIVNVNDNDDPEEGDPNFNPIAYAKTSNTDHVVPSLDLKVGIDYSHLTSGGSIIGVELGYWTKHYFDAIGDIRFIDDSHEEMIDYKMDDVAFHGIYLSLNYSA